MYYILNTYKFELGLKFNFYYVYKQTVNLLSKCTMIVGSRQNTNYY